MRTHGCQPVTSKFRLETVPVIELIESLLADAHQAGYGGNTFHYDTWRSEGAPQAALLDESLPAPRRHGCADRRTCPC